MVLEEFFFFFFFLSDDGPSFFCERLMLLVSSICRFDQS